MEGNGLIDGTSAGAVGVPGIGVVGGSIGSISGSGTGASGVVGAGTSPGIGISGSGFCGGIGLGNGVGSGRGIGTGGTGLGSAGGIICADAPEANNNRAAVLLSISLKCSFVLRR